VNWNDTDNVEVKGTGGMYLKLKDGESIDVIFLDNIAPRDVVTVDNRPETYDASKHESSEVYTRWLVNFFDVKGGVSRIWDVSNKHFQKLKAIQKKGRFPFTNIFEIQRVGEGTKTDYLVQHINEPSNEIKLASKQCELINLDSLGARGAVAQKKTPEHAVAASSPRGNGDLYQELGVLMTMSMNIEELDTVHRRVLEGWDTLSDKQSAHLVDCYQTRKGELTGARQGALI